MWLPVLVDQIGGHPGNLSLLARFFGSAHAHISWSFAVALAGTAAGGAVGFPVPALRLIAASGPREAAIVLVFVALTALGILGT